VHQAALIGIPFAILMRCSELVLFARMFVTGSLNHLVYVHETALPTIWFIMSQTSGKFMCATPSILEVLGSSVMTCTNIIICKLAEYQCCKSWG
jgi:hypothetical protein